MATLNDSKKAPAGKTTRAAIVSTATKMKAAEMNLTEEQPQVSILTSGYMDDEDDIVIVPLVKPIKAAGTKSRVGSIISESKNKKAKINSIVSTPPIDIRNFMAAKPKLVLNVPSISIEPNKSKSGDPSLPTETFQCCQQAIVPIPEANTRRISDVAALDENNFDDHSSDSSYVYSSSSDDDSFDAYLGDYDPNFVPEDKHGNFRDLTAEEKQQQQQHFNDQFNRLTETTAEMSRLARSRKINLKGSTGSKPRGGRKNSSDCKMSPKERLASNPQIKDYGIDIHAGKLFCINCSVEVGTKLSRIKKHIGVDVEKGTGKWIIVKNTQHLEKQEARRNATESQLYIKQTLIDCLATEPMSPLTGGSLISRSVSALSSAQYGLTLGDNVRSIRGYVCGALLQDGIPLNILSNPIGATRLLLEEQRCKLPREDVAQMIPIVLLAEINKILKVEFGIDPAKSSSATRSTNHLPSFSFNFDGTTDVAELLSIVIRFVKESKIIIRCICLRFYARSFDAQALANAIYKTVFDDLGLPAALWRSSTRDGASVNGAAMTNLRFLNTSCLDLVCLSHGSNVIGKIFATSCELADKSIKLWARLVESSAMVRRLFLEQAGEIAERMSQVRWYCWHNIGEQIRKFYSIIRGIVINQNIGNDATRQQLDILLRHQELEIKCELALQADLGTPLAQTCMGLEGDGFLAPITYQTWLWLHSRFMEFSDETVRPEVRVPILSDLLNELFPPGDNELEIPRAELFQSTIQKGRPVVEKYFEDSNGRLSDTLAVFAPCQLFNFQSAADHTPNAIEHYIRNAGFARLPIIANDRQLCNGMIIECQQYVTLSRERLAIWRIDNPDTLLPHEDELWEFWQIHRLQLPNWYRAASEVALLTPSSGNVERVFSLYETMFNDNQGSALEDYKQTAVLLRYNENKRRREQE